MNMPGTREGNWTWQLRRGRADEGTAARLRALTTAAGPTACPA